jgi:hypothetical protein
LQVVSPFQVAAEIDEVSVGNLFGRDGHSKSDFYLTAWREVDAFAVGLGAGKGSAESNKSPLTDV